MGRKKNNINCTQLFHTFKVNGLLITDDLVRMRVHYNGRIANSKLCARNKVGPPNLHRIEHSTDSYNPFDNKTPSYISIIIAELIYLETVTDE